LVPLVGWDTIKQVGGLKNELVVDWNRLVERTNNLECNEAHFEATILVLAGKLFYFFILLLILVLAGKWD
jgi:hypothetical protein